MNLEMNVIALREQGTKIPLFLKSLNFVILFVNFMVLPSVRIYTVI
jgi:hypothetical protein